MDLYKHNNNAIDFFRNFNEVLHIIFTRSPDVSCDGVMWILRVGLTWEGISKGMPLTPSKRQYTTGAPEAL